MIRRLARLVPAAVLAPMLGCAATTPLPERLDGGRSYDVSMAAGIDGYVRSYRLHVPEGYRSEKPTPLVVVLHGAFSTAAEMERHTGFSDLADRQGFVVAYPEGIGILGFLQHWNAGHCCGKAAADGIDDVGFLARVIDDIKRTVNIDATRVYMTGFSNGAMLTHRFAAERPDLLAAAAPLAGAIGSVSGSEEPGWQMPAARSAVPIIMFHGLLDSTIPYSQPDPADASSGRRFSSVSDSSRYWTSHNGCRQHNRADHAQIGEVTVDTWSDCHRNATVQLFTLKNWGHRWPGPNFNDSADAKSQRQRLDAAEIIWSFFQKHRRDAREV